MKLRACNLDEKKLGGWLDFGQYWVHRNLFEPSSRMTKSKL